MTFGHAVLVHSESNATHSVVIGNPAAVLDERTARIYVFMCRNNSAVLLSHSDNNAATWAPAEDVTAMAKQAGWGWVATTFSGIQLKHQPNPAKNGRSKSPLAAENICSSTPVLSLATLSLATLSRPYASNREYLLEHPSIFSRGAAACYLRFMLTRAISMASLFQRPPRRLLRPPRPQRQQEQRQRSELAQPPAVLRRWGEVAHRCHRRSVDERVCDRRA